VGWVPSVENDDVADFFSMIIDIDDWEITDSNIQPEYSFQTQTV